MVTRTQHEEDTRQDYPADDEGRILHPALAEVGRAFTPTQRPDNQGQSKRPKGYAKSGAGQAEGEVGEDACQDAPPVEDNTVSSRSMLGPSHFVCRL